MVQIWKEGELATAVKFNEINGELLSEARQQATIDRQADLEVIGLSLLNNWTAYGSGYTYPSAARQANGLIFLGGAIWKGVQGRTIASLPAGFRPSRRRIFFTGNSAGAPVRIDVDPNGDITIPENAGQTMAAIISLDTISFTNK